VARLASLLTTRRTTFWAIPIFLLSLFVYVHTMMVPGLVDRVGRFKGADYIQFYVMGSFAAQGRLDALYDPDAHIAEGRRRIHPDLQLYASHPNYGPQVALAFAPLTALPFGASLAVFLAMMTACYALSVWLLWRECDALRGHGWLVALLAAGSPLLWNATRYGQTSAIPLLLFTLAFVALRRNRPFAAGVAIGCLAFKPQLGIVLAAVCLYPAHFPPASNRRRIVAGAALAVGGQLAIAWVAAGSAVMTQYVSALWRLALDPSVIEVYPSEIHSLRGFLQLLIPAAGVVSVVSAAGTIAAIVAAIRCCAPVGPHEDRPHTLELRWGLLVLLTIIASPHLVSYDLLLLTVPLLLSADWSVRHQHDDASGFVRVMLPLLYFAPFSGMVVARLTGVQVSTIVMIALAWRVAVVCRRVGAERRDARDGRAEAGGGVVPEFEHARVAIEY
jgi:alpha-1,2-mannosyltransferase